MNQNYEIKPVKTGKDKIKHPELAEAGVIPKLGASMVIVGNSGSGKSVLLHNLLTRKEFYRNQFDKIFVISPTCQLDDVQLALKIPDARTFDDLSIAAEALKKIMASQRKIIEEEGIAKAPRYCIVFDDCIGNTKFMNSTEFTDCFIKSRHYGTSVFFLSQYYRSLPKKCRLQASFLCFFAISNAEAETLSDDFAPPGVSKKQFQKLIDNNVSKRFDFLSINRVHPWETRFRKGLAEVIDLEPYKKGYVEQALKTPYEEEHGEKEPSEPDVMAQDRPLPT